MIEQHNLVVYRHLHIEANNALFSKWYVNGRPLCVGVENAKLAIPPGAYIATMSYSPKFDAMYYELACVPKRDEILIHPANWPHELEGCLAPGMSLFTRYNGVTNSRDARDALHTTTGGNRS